MSGDGMDWIAMHETAGRLERDDKDKVQRLAGELVTEVQRRLELETGQLQWRIREALAYMGAVEKPNGYTLDHIRRYLTGEYDKRPPADADQSV